MPVYDDNITTVPKGTAPAQTIVPKPYTTPATLAITTEADIELLMENGVTLLVEGTI